MVLKVGKRFRCSICGTSFESLAEATDCENQGMVKTRVCGGTDWAIGMAFTMVDMNGLGAIPVMIGGMNYADHLLTPIFKDINWNIVDCWTDGGGEIPAYTHYKLMKPISHDVDACKRYAEAMADQLEGVDRVVNSILPEPPTLPETTAHILAKDICVKTHIQALKEVKAQMELELNDSGSERCWVCGGPPNHNHHIDYQNDITVPLCTRCHGRVHSMLRRL